MCNGRFDILLAREKLLAQQGQRAARAEDIASLLSLAETMADPQRLAQARVRQAGYLSDTGQEPGIKTGGGKSAVALPPGARPARRGAGAARVGFHLLVYQ